MQYMLPVQSLTGARHTQAEHERWERPAASRATPGNPVLSAQAPPVTSSHYGCVQIPISRAIYWNFESTDI